MPKNRKLVPMDEEMQRDIEAVRVRLGALQGERTSFARTVRVLIRLGLGKAKELQEAAVADGAKGKEEAAP